MIWITYSQRIKNTFLKRNLLIDNLRIFDKLKDLLYQNLIYKEPISKQLKVLLRMYKNVSVKIKEHYLQKY